MASAAIGFFDPHHPAGTLIAGEAAARHWQTLDAGQRATLPARMATAGSHTLLLARGSEALEAAPFAAAGLLVERHPQDADHALLAHRRSVLAWQRAPHLTVHGVFLSVLGLGVLLQGPSGVGKSELALDLVARGHPLVADDAVELRRLAGTVLVGESTPLLYGFMEVRGLGVLDLVRTHGPQAVKPRERLDLVIHLDAAERPVFSGEDRLRGRRGSKDILGVAVPQISFARGLGHNLAPLVETACRDHWLRLTGYAADEAFEQRQQAAISDTHGDTP